MRIGRSISSLILLVLFGLAPARAISVLGTVETTAGAAVAGARVELEPLSGNYERARRFLEARPSPEPVASTLTDERGRFTLDAPASGLYTVTVRAAGLLPLELVPLTLTEPRELPPARLPADVGSRVEVRDSRGEALADAWVFARRAGMLGAQGWAPAQRLARTGKDGFAVLPRAAGERLDVALYVAGRVHLEERRGVTHVTFTVPPATGERQSLRVRAEDGTPLKGVVATLGDHDWPVGTTDERGLLSFPAPRRMPLALRLLSADGRALRTAFESPSQQLTLPAAAPATGRVLRQGDRRPVAGALVWPASDPGSFVRSDEQGRYGLTLAGDRRGLRVEAKGFLPAKVDHGTEILLVAAQPAAGRVIDAEGRPLAGVEVLLRPAGSPPHSRAILAATAEDGRFEVAHLPASQVDVLARRRGYAPTFARGLRAKVAPGGAAADLGTLILVPGTAIRGTVLDAEGEGIPGVGVWLSSRLEKSAADLLADETGEPPDVVTDGKGLFAVEDLEPGAAFHLLLRGDGYLPAALDAVTAPSPEGLTVVLERATAVRGRVLDQDEEPIAGAAVTLGPPPVVGRLELPRLGREHVHRTVTEADGSFRLDTVAVGPYQVSVDAEGYLRPEPMLSEVTGGGEDPEILVVLERGATLAGRVTTAEGQPVAGARILAGNGSSLSDSDGGYLAVGLPLGRQKIELRHPVLNAAVAEMDIEEGENVHDFVLEAGHELSGRAIDEGGAALTGVRVELEQQGWEDRHYLKAWSGEDGTFHFPEVAAGSYLLRASKSGYAAVELPAPVTVEDTVRDVEVVLPAGTVIRGFVRGLDFQELAGVEIEAESAGAPVRSATVDYQSAYEVTDLGPGDWLLRARTPDGQREARARIVVEPGVREMERDLEFGGGHVLEGLVILGDEPLPGAGVSLTGLDLDLRRQVLADHEGGFRFQDLPEGNYRLSANHPRQQLVSNQVLTITADEQVTIEMEGAKVHGYVRAAGGGPLADARIRLQQILTDGGGGSLYGLYTDPEGYFALPQLTGGRYRITIGHDGYREKSEVVELVAGVRPAPLRYELEPTAGLTLEVAFADGSRPPYVTVGITGEDGRTAFLDRRNLGADGRVLFPTLGAGSWDVQVSAPGAVAQERTVEVPGEPLPVLLAPASRLHLRLPALVESDRVATVHLFDAAGRPFRTVGEGGIPAEHWELRGGVADVAGVPSGEWTVEVVAGDGQTWRQSLTTAPGDVRVIVQ